MKSCVAAFVLLACIAPKPSSASAAQFSREQIEYFEKHVRPVFAQVCSKCHVVAKPKGGLRLDSRDALLRGGDTGPAIVPGKPDDSELIQAIRYGQNGYQMPPDGKLPEKTIAALTQWVAMGAPWPDQEESPPSSTPNAPRDLVEQAKKHWSFLPLRNVSPPPIKNDAWPQSAIDYFILAKLEAEGLSPAPPAGKRALIRRVTYDLIGLPPAPSQIDEFLADDSPQAFEKVVDRLLASPHYGERWGRHWLDLVRFAETRGHEFDFDIFNAYEYRDYVVRALNADVPYAQFVVEHVAGDLLTHPRVHPVEGFNESIIGTGFFFLGEGTHSPVDIRKDEADRVDNQIDVFSRAFFGLTVACARCHDHKFDPIGTADYYGLYGVLQSSRYQESYIDSPLERRAIARELVQLRDTFRSTLSQTIAEVGRSEIAEIPNYLLAYRDLHHPSDELLRKFQQTPDGDSIRPDIVFEDFETSAYEGWTATGNAFGSRPNQEPLPKYQGDVGAIGAGFVNSHSALNDDGKRTVGDHLTGTLTSRPFTIDRRYVRFLIGGGGHVGKTCVNLHVDGRVVKTATGRNENRMHVEQFDVRPFLGMQAHLEIVDQQTGQWGNIGQDHIVFTDREEPGQRAHRIAVTARLRRLDPGKLKQWVDHLDNTAATDERDLLHAWALRVTQEKPESQKEVVGQSAKLSDTRKKQNGSPDHASVFEDFENSTYENWFLTGEAFGVGPTQSPALFLTSDNGGCIRSVVPAGVAHSGLIAGHLRGVIRSETFTIEKRHIFYRMAGDRAHLNLIIDGFQLIRAPIYGGLKIKLDNQHRFNWHTQDVSKWVGHKAYIEIIDDGAGYIAVDRILFSEEGPPLPSPNSLLVEMLDDANLDSPQSLADRHRDLFDMTLRRWTKDRLASTSKPSDHIDILNWMIDRDLLPIVGQESLRPLLQDTASLEAKIRYRKRAMAMVDGTRENERIHIRGNHKKLGDVATTRFLEALGGLQHKPITQGSGRDIIANHMISDANPLLPRVMVNRIWQHHFGTGIVASPDDFGFQGERPTHPELLDYLAVQFIRRGWSIKQIHRLMLLSSTYQMSSQPEPRAETADPENKLLHRMPVRRLESEIIRDAILAVSGRLNKKRGGPSVMPYLTSFMEGRGRPARSGPLDGNGRRSIYVGVRRNFLTPMFLAFDTPVPFSTMGRRSVSNVPAQALTMMNNPFVVEQARIWSERLLQDASRSVEQRIGDMYLAAFGRLPLSAEFEAACDFLENQEKQYDSDHEHQAWADLCHVLLNVKEFIYVN